MSGALRRIPGLAAAMTALAICACVAAAADAVPDATLDWGHPWLQPHDARAAAAASDEYAWRLFVALNWPADARSRTADARATLEMNRPTVWEAWENTATIFRDDGADPGPWRGAMTPAGLADPARFETVSLKDRPNLRHIVRGQMVPLADPVSGARRLTEIRMNLVAYDYIRAHELYNLDGQMKALAEHRSVSFPAATTEVKAKWRPIAAADRSRYHTVEVRQADGTTRLYGLTALHVVTKDLPSWFWATFEHLDNPRLADADGWQLPSSDHFACARSLPDCNRMPIGIGIENSVWQFYRLRGTLTRYVDADGQPLRLANSELEAGLQATASCMTCHARASIGAAAGAPVRLPIFDDASAAPGDDPSRRVGFLGLPQADWFTGARGTGGSTPTYQQLDFVWSLSKAQPKRGT
jgi:hypothetical protein